jgi:hypothetical protein
VAKKRKRGPEPAHGPTQDQSISGADYHELVIRIGKGPEDRVTTMDQTLPPVVSFSSVDAFLKCIQAFTSHRVALMDCSCNCTLAGHGSGCPMEHAVVTAMDGKNDHRAM